MEVKPSVLLCVSSEIECAGLTYALTDSGNFTVLGQCSDSSSLFVMLQDLGPDIVVIDLQTRLMNGVEAAIRIKSSYPNVKIMLLLGEQQSLAEVFAARADGYFSKSDAIKNILKGIGCIKEGAMWLSPGVAMHVHALVSSAHPQEIPFTPRTEAPAQRVYYLADLA